MNKASKGLASIASICLLGCTVGCNRTETPTPKTQAKKDPLVIPFKNPDPTPTERASGSNPSRPSAPVGEKATEAAPAVMPEVSLSEAHQATCLVKVGDPLPDGELVNFDGEKKNLSDLLGEKLTVVCFWQSENLHSTLELEDLGPDVLDNFSMQGVNVVAVHVAGNLEQAQQAAEEAKADFPLLFDSEGTYYTQVATIPPPRTFLLDAEGKIIWFDIEYSRDTRRSLKQAIDFQLSDGK